MSFIHISNFLFHLAEDLDQASSEDRYFAKLLFHLLCIKIVFVRYACYFTTYISLSYRKVDAIGKNHSHFPYVIKGKKTVTLVVYVKAELIIFKNCVVPQNKTNCTNCPGHLEN